MIREVIYYRAVCDAENCGVSAQDGGEYTAWEDAATAWDEAIDADWWHATGDGDRRLLCPEHAPRCAQSDCHRRLWDDEFGAFCEDHAPDPDPSPRGSYQAAGGDT